MVRNVFLINHLSFLDKVDFFNLGIFCMESEERDFRFFMKPRVKWGIDEEIGEKLFFFVLWNFKKKSCFGSWKKVISKLKNAGFINWNQTKSYPKHLKLYKRERFEQYETRQTMFESTMYITRKEKLIKRINLISILIWILLLLLLEQERILSDVWFFCKLS